jgi:hypothetical protein
MQIYSNHITEISKVKSKAYLVSAMKSAVIELIKDFEIKIIYPSQMIQTQFQQELSSINMDVLKKYPNIKLDFVQEFKEAVIDENAPKFLSDREVLSLMIDKNPILGQIVSKFNFRLP